jgi:hypothetical protein
VALSILHDRTQRCPRHVSGKATSRVEGRGRAKRSSPQAAVASPAPTDESMSCASRLSVFADHRSRSCFSGRTGRGLDVQSPRAARKFAPSGHS